MSREGFYSVVYGADGEQGMGMLVLDTGMVVGADMTGIIYDGTYEVLPGTGRIRCTVLGKVTQPGVYLMADRQQRELPVGFTMEFSGELAQAIGEEVLGTAVLRGSAA